MLRSQDFIKNICNKLWMINNMNFYDLQPHLHTIVNRSMELAMSAKEPYNYFLLLRALFRSIGGGSHDLLYQEFLPLLENLLQGLCIYTCIVWRLWSHCSFWPARQKFKFYSCTVLKHCLRWTVWFDKELCWFWLLSQSPSIGESV